MRKRLAAVFAAVITLLALFAVANAAASAGPSPSPHVTANLNPPPTGTAPTPHALPATVVTIKEACHELTGQEFGFANGTGRLDANTVRIVFSSWLSGNVRVYVDGVYRLTEYLDRNLQNGGYPLSVTFSNTRLQHDYAAWQSADLGFHYPNTPAGYQYTWSSSGIYGVVAVGANHCQTQTEAVG